MAAGSWKRTPPTPVLRLQPFAMFARITAKPCKQRYSVPHGYADVAMLLQDDGVDLVSIHAPDGLHARFALAALDAGKHVFVEKPMATSIEDCLQVVERADRASTRMAVGHVLRTRPYFRMVKEMVDAGELGSTLCNAYALPHRCDAERSRIPGQSERKLLATNAYDGCASGGPDALVRR